MFNALIKSGLGLLLVIYCTSVAARPYIPYTQTEEVCELANNLYQLDKRQYDNFADQIGILGDCLYHEGQLKEAMDKWLESASHGSAYGLEVAGIMHIASANNTTEVFFGLSLLRQLELKDESRFQIYFLYRGISYLGHKFLPRDDKMALRSFINAIESGSFEAAYLVAYLIDTGFFEIQDESYGKSYWLKLGADLKNDVTYDAFVNSQIMSRLYGIDELLRKNESDLN